MTKRLLLTSIIIAIIFFIGLPSVYAQEHENKHETKVEKFSPGDMIIEHVIDAHDWHIMTIGHHHISIPLPIIVYSKISGWNIFSSSHLAHGEVYKNFKLMKKNIKHPSLHLKKVDVYWSVRIGRRYRALAVEIEEDLIWFWVGKHSDYDRLINS